MPTQSYRITDPHPSIPPSHIYTSGRGGIGNMTHVDPQHLTSASTIIKPKPTTAGPRPGSSASTDAGGSSTMATGHYTAGRGGAGNMHAYSYVEERPIFSFDEELERQTRMMRHIAPVYHFGRGGAGNCVAGSGGSSSSGGVVSAAAAAVGHGSGMGSMTSASEGSSGSSASSAGNEIRGGSRRPGFEERWARLRGSLLK